MKDIVLITGANGDLAKTVKQLLSNSYQIRCLTTNKKNVDGKSIFYWDINKNYIDADALKECKHIIHLAGYSILNKWTKENIKLMYKSRVSVANLLFNKCEELNIHPETFISASASGIYGLTASGIKTEDDKMGSDWISKMVYDWEAAAEKFKQLGSRVIKMRISLLLSKTSGFLKYTLLSMKYGIGVIVGPKENPINWIHIDDAASFVQQAIKNSHYQGSYNLASEQTVSQNEFIKTIKSKVFAYSLIIRMPISLIRPLVGERSLIINSKFTLSVEKLKKTGFIWKYSSLEDVLDNKKGN